MEVYLIKDKEYGILDSMVFLNKDAIKNSIKSKISDDMIFNNYYVSDWSEMSTDAIGGIDSIDKYSDYLLKNNCENFHIIKRKVIE